MKLICLVVTMEAYLYGTSTMRVRLALDQFFNLHSQASNKKKTKIYFSNEQGWLRCGGFIREISHVNIKFY